MLRVLTLLFAALLPLCCCGEYIDVILDQLDQDVDVLLTTPRSGTNLTMGIVTALTKKPVISLLPKAHTNRLNLPLDHTKTPLLRTHVPITSIDPNRSRLLFILRNYKECLVRREKQKKKDQFTSDCFRDIIVNEKAEFKDYIKNLKYYERWPNPKTKLIIYYEDLIKSPRTEIPKILALFDEPAADLESFFAGYDAWKILLLQHYQNQHGIEYSSGGDKELFHSKDFPPSLLEEVDSHIKTKYPGMWGKYLSRYESKNE